MNKIVITGGSGFIGTMLSSELLSRGYKVVSIDKKTSRIKNENLQSIELDLVNEAIPVDVIDGSYAVINLAGAPIFGRFTKKYKKIISESRLNTTSNIVNAISQSKNKPKVLVSASAVGYYGDANNNTVYEESRVGRGFLSHLCYQWESIASKASTYGLRVVLLRTAYVLGQGGILATLIPMFKKRIGGYFGNGQQIMPFVSANDLVNIYIYSIENDSMQGPYNTSVAHAMQKDFMKIIAQNAGTKLVWRIPKIFGYIAYLSFIDSLTDGVVVNSQKLLKTGFKFKDTKIEDIIKDVYQKFDK